MTSQRRECLRRLEERAARLYRSYARRMATCQDLYALWVDLARQKEDRARMLTAPSGDMPHAHEAARSDNGGYALAELAARLAAAERLIAGGHVGARLMAALDFEVIDLEVCRQMGLAYGEQDERQGLAIAVRLATMVSLHSDEAHLFVEAKKLVAGARRARWRYRRAPGERLRPKPMDRESAAMPAKLPPTRADAFGARRAASHIRKLFTDCDRDAFIAGAFDYIAERFETSMRLVESENPEARARFKRRGDSAFTATVYVRGAAAAECKVWYGAQGGLDCGIVFSYHPASENSFNEQLFAEDDGYEFRLEPLGMAMSGASAGPMTKEEAADYYWNLFFKRLE